LVNHGEHREHGEKPLVDCGDNLIGEVINAAIAVHKVLGPGLLESVYEQALAFELSDRNIGFCRQVEVPVVYRGNDLGVGFRADMIVEDVLVLELKAIDEFRIKRGLLLNFNTKLLKDGIKRVSI